MPYTQAQYCQMKRDMNAGLYVVVQDWGSFYSFDRGAGFAALCGGVAGQPYPQPQPPTEPIIHPPVGGITTPISCPRGEKYDKPWFGLGGCDDGYVSSEGAWIQGMGSQCVCASSPDAPSTGGAVTGGGGGTGGTGGPGGPGGTGGGTDLFGMMGKMIDALPMLMLGYIAISITGMFKK